MIEKQGIGIRPFGIVTNILSERLAKGDEFGDLIRVFIDQGFTWHEVRDLASLRLTPFGRMLTDIELLAESCSDVEWRDFCLDIHRQGNTLEGPESEPQSKALGKPVPDALWGQLTAFVKAIRGAIVTFAIEHAWMGRPADLAADDGRISIAMRVAYLLSPVQARLRLVDLTTTASTLDRDTAVANLKRYMALSSTCPVSLAVENSIVPASVSFEIAQEAGVGFAYDEANNFQGDGTPKEPLSRFWDLCSGIALLASVHLKQRTTAGVTSRLGDGFVDFAALLNRLDGLGFSGDLLLENQPSDDPLGDAVKSRDYLLTLGYVFP